MTDLRDYHNFYTLTNVFLLANVFENFREVCLQYYCINPAHNYTFSGLSWQAALKMMNGELYLLTDIHQHLFIIEGIRGRVAMTSHRYTRANAPGVEHYDDKKRNSYIMYLETNSSYGWAKSKKLYPRLSSNSSQTRK